MNLSSVELAHSHSTGHRLSAAQQNGDFRSNGHDGRHGNDIVSMAVLPVGDFASIMAGHTVSRSFGHPAVRRPRVSVIIPALNEAENLPHVLPRIPAWIDEIILIPGPSTDGTAEVARALIPTIRIVDQDGKGKGAALRSGIRAATGDIIVLMDADGSTDPAEIPAFVAALMCGADYAKGSRFLQGAGTDDMPHFRQLGNGGLTTLTNVLFGTRFTDITYGYNAVWRKHADALALEIDGWPCEIIGNIRAAKNSLRIVEVPSYERCRIAGQAKLSTFSAGWAILMAILREAASGKRNQLRQREEMRVHLGSSITQSIH